MRRLIPVLVIAAPVLWLLGRILVRGHVRVSPDSAVYLVGARNIGRGLGYLGPDGEPVSVFPPGYPLLLAAWPSEVWAAIINLAALAVIGWCSWRLAKHFGLPAWVAPLVVGFNPAIQRVGLHVWSEMPFIALVLGAFLAHVTGKTWRASALAGVLLGTAVTFRTVGWFFVVAAVGVSVLRRKWIAAFLAVLPAAAAGVAWRAMAGDAGRADTEPAFGALLVAAKYLGSWFFADTIGWFSLTGLVVVAVAVVAAARRGMWEVLAWGGGFLVALGAAKMVTPIDDLGHRLLSPVAPFVGLGVVAALTLPRVLAVLAAVGLVAGAVVPAVTTYEPLPFQASRSVLDPVCELPGEAWSNTNFHVAWHCDRVVKDGPRRGPDQGPEGSVDHSRIREDLDRGCVVAVWADESSSYYLSRREVQEVYGLESVFVGAGFVALSSC